MVVKATNLYVGLRTTIVRRPDLLMVPTTANDIIGI